MRPVIHCSRVSRSSSSRSTEAATAARTSRRELSRSSWTSSWYWRSTSASVAWAAGNRRRIAGLSVPSSRTESRSSHTALRTSRSSGPRFTTKRSGPLGWNVRRTRKNHGPQSCCMVAHSPCSCRRNTSSSAFSRGPSTRRPGPSWCTSSISARRLLQAVAEQLLEHEGHVGHEVDGVVPDDDDPRAVGFDDLVDRRADRRSRPAPCSTGEAVIGPRPCGSRAAPAHGRATARGRAAAPRSRRGGAGDVEADQQRRHAGEVLGVADGALDDEHDERAARPQRRTVRRRRCGAAGPGRHVSTARNTTRSRRGSGPPSCEGERQARRRPVAAVRPRRADRPVLTVPMHDGDRAPATSRPHQACARRHDRAGAASSAGRPGGAAPRRPARAPSTATKWPMTSGGSRSNSTTMPPSTIWATTPATRPDESQVRSRRRGTRTSDPSTASDHGDRHQPGDQPVARTRPSRGTRRRRDHAARGRTWASPCSRAPSR